MKYILLVVLLLTSSIGIVAEPSLMISVGANYSTITGSDSLVRKSYPKLGYGINLGFEQNFSRHFSLITGVSLETRGEKNTSDKKIIEGVTQEIVEKTDILNLQVPLLAQINFPFGAFCLNFFAGPELGIFLSGEKKVDSTTNIVGPPSQTVVIKDTANFSKDMKMLEFGINVGIGLEIKTGDFGAICIRPGYYLGLTDILAKNEDVASNSNLSGKNQNIYCSLGYKFNIKRN